jgi:hypothetical protein
MEGWMISLGFGAITIAVAWGYNKATSAQLKDDIKKVQDALQSHADKDDRVHERETLHHADIHKDFIERHNATFNKIDALSEKITILERDTSTHLTMPKAEQKFVSKGELELHLKNIELTMTHTSKNVDLMMGKLDILLDKKA